MNSKPLPSNITNEQVGAVIQVLKDTGLYPLVSLLAVRLFIYGLWMQEKENKKNMKGGE